LRPVAGILRQLLTAGTLKSNATSDPSFELTAGLPDGIFFYQKSQFGNILKGLGMYNVWYTYFISIGKVYGHLVCFWHFGVICGHLVYFPLFGMLYQENLATLVNGKKSKEGQQLDLLVGIQQTTKKK
jgi:hypothetical protein